MDQEKKTGNRGMKKLLLGLLCGVLSFGIDFIVIPQLSGGEQGEIWTMMMLLLPAVTALFLFRSVGYSPAYYVFAGLPIQYLLLCILQRPVADMMGLAMANRTAFMGEVGGWPAVATVVQFCTLALVHKLDGNSGKPRRL